MPPTDASDTPPTDPPEPAPPSLGEPEHRVSPRAVAYWRVSAAVGWVVFLGVLVAVWLLWLDHLSWPPVVLVGLGVWAVVHVLVMPPLRYRVHRWEVTPVAVRTRSGWLNREQRIAPLSRAQTIDSTQGAIMRLFGVASITVTTASAAGPVTIEGLDQATAEQLAARLTAVTGATPDDAT